MRLYVHTADVCEEEAKKYGAQALVASVKKQIETTQSLIGFDFFVPTSFIKKGLGRSFRLIAYRVAIGADELILFLRVLGRGSKDYEYFLQNWDENTEVVKRQFQPYDDQQLQRIHANLTTVAPPSPPPTPNEEERAWLYEVLRRETAADQLIVLETDAWVRKMRAPTMRDFLALYHQAIEQMNLDQLRPATTNAECDVFWEQNKRVGFAYLYRPQLHRLILLEPLRHSEDADAVLNHHRQRLSKVDDSVHELSRIAGRSYPYLMVLDQDAWLAIQKDEEANLALSPEEAELLESVRGAGAEGDLNYPLFINGRAGSGKSTMLQYLSADYVDFSIRRNTALLPIYMTCSRDLLERARETVRGLLTAHHERLLEGVHDAGQIDKLLANSFVVFHEFLYSLLEPHAEKRFAPQRYVNYAEFRRLWAADFARRPESKRISLDVAWHTIRSFIKGVRSTEDDELGPDEFAALPRRRRSVSLETYREIYERVWQSWYKRLCEEEGYWDDQDLAACILASGIARASNFAAVFCDEAQDFTPLELEIIFQLSVYSKRSLVPEELKRVPIVFAGDPLQTINPTGFRWDTVRADFHERFCAVLDPRRRSRADVSYRELRFNYRSNPGIVRFCNLIQLIRAALLGVVDALPQEAWWVDEPVQTVWFAADNAFTKQQLQHRPELVKLVNCEEGEESSYARSDSVLNSLEEGGDGVFRNVLGPTRAKGLEFPAVVLYRFSDTAPKDFIKLLTGDLDVREDPESQLPYEYFFNRLYVAASRGKGQLVIVDSSKAFDNFWRFATDPDIADRLMNQLQRPDLWKNSINYLVRGREESWTGDRIDPREQASDYLTQGRRNRDAYLLRQAALAYRSANDELEAGRCLALAEEFEGKLREAGDRYRNLGLLDDAFRCYWVGRHLGSICELGAKEPAFASRLETRAADFVARSSGLDSNFLSEVLKAAQDPAWKTEVSQDGTWKLVLQKLLERLGKATPKDSLPLRDAFTVLRELSAQGAFLPEADLASLAYVAGAYAAAINLWERAGVTDGEGYRRAKARLAPFPENISWLGRLKQHNEVLSQWREHRSSLTTLSGLDDSIVRAVVDAALDGGELELASEILALKPDRDRVSAILISAAKNNDGAAALAGALIGLRFYVASGSWGAVVRAAESADFGDLVKGNGGRLRSILQDQGSTAEIFRAALEELAASPELASESPERQGPIAEFLQRNFVAKGASAARNRGVSPEVAGAAIERAGKIVDALQYYENLGRDVATTEEVKQFAAERLVRNLERHALYSRGRGDEGQARDRDMRAKRIRESAKLGDRRLPEYPVLQATNGPIAPLEWTHGVFRVVQSRDRRRMRIEHMERFETVTVDATEKQLRGDAAFAELGAAGEAFASWQIPAWNATIKLIHCPEGLRVAVVADGETFEEKLADP